MGAICNSIGREIIDHLRRVGKWTTSFCTREIAVDEKVNHMAVLMPKIREWAGKATVQLLRSAYFLWPLAIGYIFVDWFGSPQWKEITDRDWVVVGLIYASYVLILAIWKIPVWQTRGLETRHSLVEVGQLQDSFRRTIAQVAGGAVLLVGLYFTWANLITVQQSQITERFTRAVEQLGSKDIAVRMGGVYGLERIARDSRVDHGQVIKILSAFVRSNAFRDSSKSTFAAAALDNKQSVSRNQIRLREDIQTALTVIGRRDSRHDEAPVDLRNTYLGGANLVSAELSEADLNKVDLRFSDLTQASLSHANLGNAILHRAKLNGANMSNVVLVGSDLSQANLSEANLQGALLENINVTGAIFWGAKLNGATFRDVDLSQAIGLSTSQLGVVRMERNVILPPEFKKESH
jgi:uncharacterized protein YjbI with pentapeptide repeats